MLGREATTRAWSAIMAAGLVAHARAGLVGTTDPDGTRIMPVIARRPRRHPPGDHDARRLMLGRAATLAGMMAIMAATKGYWGMATTYFPQRRGNRPRHLADPSTALPMRPRCPPPDVRHGGELEGMVGIGRGSVGQRRWDRGEIMVARVKGSAPAPGFPGTEIMSHITMSIPSPRRPRRHLGCLPHAIPMPAA